MRRALPLALLLTGCRPDVVSHDLGVKFAPPEAPATFPVERPITIEIPTQSTKLKLELTSTARTVGIGLETLGPRGTLEALRTETTLPPGLPALHRGAGWAAPSYTFTAPDGARRVTAVVRAERREREAGRPPFSIFVTPNYALDAFPSQGWERRVELEYVDAAGKKIPPIGRRPW